MKNVLHNIKGGQGRGGAGGGVGRFQVSLFLPAATASYMTKV